MAAYRVKSELLQLETFFRSSKMWRDMVGVFEESIEEGRDQLEANVGPDGEKLDDEGRAFIGGRLAQIRLFLALQTVLTDRIVDQNEADKQKREEVEDARPEGD